jgi:hypothetical protein
MDIVEQLRKSANTVYSQDGYTFRLGLQNEAANEIERMRNKVRWLEMCENTVLKQDNKIERLLDALRWALPYVKTYERVNDIVRAALKEGE